MRITALLTLLVACAPAVADPVVSAVDEVTLPVAERFDLLFLVDNVGVINDQPPLVTTVNRVLHNVSSGYWRALQPVGIPYHWGIAPTFIDITGPPGLSGDGFATDQNTGDNINDVLYAALDDAVRTADGDRPEWRDALLELVQTEDWQGFRRPDATLHVLVATSFPDESTRSRREVFDWLGTQSSAVRLYLATPPPEGCPEEFVEPSPSYQDDLAEAPEVLHPRWYSTCADSRWTKAFIYDLLDDLVLPANTAIVDLTHAPIEDSVRVYALPDGGAPRLLPRAQWQLSGDQTIEVAPPIQPAVGVRVEYDWATGAE